MGVGEKVNAIRRRLAAMKKEDYIALALLGILLVVIAIPIEKKDKPSTSDMAGKQGTKKMTTLGAGEEGGKIDQSGLWEYQNPITRETLCYGEEMEQKLESMLKTVEGVGDVRAMIMFSNSGRDWIEKDSNQVQNSHSETESNGKTRQEFQSQEDKTTVYTVNELGESVPLIIQKQLPKVTGVLIVAQGASNRTVKENIIQSVKVLFKLDEHSIKVITMKSKRGDES